MTFWDKDKNVASLLSFVYLIPVEEKTTGKGGSRKMLFIIFSYDDWNGEQHAVSAHLIICKRYCDSRMWLSFHSSDVMSDGSFPT